jgi:hypothetical protein
LIACLPACSVPSPLVPCDLDALISECGVRITVCNVQASAVLLTGLRAETAPDRGHVHPASCCTNEWLYRTSDVGRGSLILLCKRFTSWTIIGQGGLLFARSGHSSLHFLALLMHAAWPIHTYILTYIRALTPSRSHGGESC